MIGKREKLIQRVSESKGEEIMVGERAVHIISVIDRREAYIHGSKRGEKVIQNMRESRGKSVYRHTH